ncbi:hypothetical protein GGS23DRAFT_4071 [Durotheca rogersii]|uniref:uncharacterized protein n=1 Tax=Durotheca rogersii TaxID=419775 RepID=UPI00221FCA20|nr:uncharacterized protein GGS23DRAFT_4071 [Durotheca rogersii]KAI5867951.1 hypothetical protein GGS23DRAFT_4071 [Durotheca rogersii]
MANPRDKARASWSDAQKIRPDITGKLSSLKKERGNTNTTSRFEEVEQTMAEFRLACMNVIAYDFEYAVDKNVEHFLWQAHTYLNGEYRKVMSRLMAQNQVVVRRKLEKQYRGFLRTSQSFYRVYIQQLSGRFYIPELHQVAHGTDLESAVAPTPDATPPSRLRALILKSCQITLVHLGDLVRYRCQMSEKLSNSNTNFDKALEYYGLANTIDPDDGSAHHQLAVLYQLQGRHLDIVYHFHRAICIAKPHELALGNLEREYKGLENPLSNRRGVAKDPCETMITWFVRLHAFFFQGEQFSQQSELEEEVLHRVEMAMKSDADEATLRKMIFVNIAAYDVATSKVNSAWTLQGSQSCQFVLRFNIRTILILLRLLKTKILEESATSSASDHEGEVGEEAESVICFSPILMKLLPLLRLYISWIYVARADVIKYQAYLGPYVRDVYRFLADTLTLLNSTIGQAAATTSSKYLLPEDTEALGLRPLGDRDLPLFLQVKDVRSASQSKKHKAPKPRQRAFGRQYKPRTEAIWRVRDIAYCGILLAGSPNFPVDLTLRQHEGREVECWTFTEESTPPASMDEAGLSRMLEKLKFGRTKAKPDSPTHEELDATPFGNDSVDAPPSLFGDDDGDEGGDGASPELSDRLDKGKSTEKKPPPPPDSLLDTDLSGDRDMINMVNKLVDPIEDVRPQSSRTQTDTTYGMDTSMANDIFGRFMTGSTQPSPAASKTIPNLPWDYFYTPTPHRSSNSQGDNQLSPDGNHIPRSANVQLDGFGSSSYLSDLSTPAQRALVSAMDQIPAHHNGREFIAHNSPRLPQGMPDANSRQGRGVPDSLEASRSAVLDSLNSALNAQHGSAPNKTRQSNSLASHAKPQRSISGTSSSPFLSDVNSPQLYNAGDSLGSGYAERPASQRATAVSSQSPSGLGTVGQSPRKRDTFQDTRSRFQNVSSPAGYESGYAAPGNPSSQGGAANGRTAPGAFQQQYPSWLGEQAARGSSSLPFSHPSSLFAGTPTVPPSGPPNPVFSNGNYYNASTPFGWLGDGANTRDDPTHFRSQLKTTIGHTADSYDKKILQAALLDDNKKQRPK